MEQNWKAELIATGVIVLLVCSMHFIFNYGQKKGFHAGCVEGVKTLSGLQGLGTKEGAISDFCDIISRGED